jgi:peptide/nickel transport system ATP-binding protein
MYLGELVDVGPAAAVFAPPHHPYTEALLSAVSLNLGELPAERARLLGDIPSPTHPPSGCRFHTRCPRFLGDICKTQLPPWQRLEDGHAYRCHIPPEDLGRLQRRAGAPEPEAVAPAAGRAGRRS